ncbi:MAG TPA: GcrA family cell cycle regulator [Hyphomicrobiaceae bacterium]|nr:GcrA family cell cycle regulator [Hyphomicrobiaceae bacterium]
MAGAAVREGAMSKKISKTKTMADLEANDCRWPIGDPREANFHFCGAQKVLGRPYCMEHWTLSFDATKTRRPSSAPMLPIRRAA